MFSGVFARAGALADDAAWLQAVLDAEAALARATERAGLAPPGSGAAVTAAARASDFDAAQLGELAALTANPVPGLARALARQVGGQHARAVHRGVTSQDVLDTAAMLLAKRAIEVTRERLLAAAGAAAALAGAHRSTLMIGRTLLQQAVPVTFGLVAAGWLNGLDEAIAGLSRVRAGRLAVQFGGAAGTLASLGAHGPRVAALFAEETGLGLAVMPWHTQRLRIIEIATALAGATAALGKIARDVTLLAQPEVGELREGGGAREVGASREGGGAREVGGARAGGDGERDDAGPRRGGSSTMPHKHNPVAAVAILGCSRQAPGLVATLVASAEAEEQRAAGGWHAEWQPFGHLLTLAGSAASWGAELLAGLEVDAQRMAANLAATEGLPMAEHVAALLAGVLGGAQAHDLVAEAAERAALAGLQLRDVLLGVPEMEERLNAAGIAAEQIEAALDPAGYLGAAQHFTDAALAAHASFEEDAGRG